MAVGHKIDNVVLKISGLNESLRNDLNSLSNAVAEISELTENLRHELISSEEIAYMQAGTEAFSSKDAPLSENIEYITTQAFIDEETPSSTSENKIDNMMKKASGLKLNDAVSKISKLAENVQSEVNSSETIFNLKVSAGNKIGAVAKRVDEFAENVSQSQGDESTDQATTLKAKLLSKKSNIYIIGAIIAAVAIALVLFVPFFRWVFLIGAAGWLGYAFFKKSNKVLPIIVLVIAVALVIFIPSDGIGGGSSLDGTWAWDGNSDNGTLFFEFSDNRFKSTMSVIGVPDFIDEGRISISGDTITFFYDDGFIATFPFSLSRNIVTWGDFRLTRVR